MEDAQPKTIVAVPLEGVSNQTVGSHIEKPLREALGAFETRIGTNSVRYDFDVIGDDTSKVYKLETRIDLSTPKDRSAGHGGIWVPHFQFTAFYLVEPNGKIKTWKVENGATSLTTKEVEMVVASADFPSTLEPGIVKKLVALKELSGQNIALKPTMQRYLSRTVEKRALVPTDFSGKQNDLKWVEYQ